MGAAYTLRCSRCDYESGLLYLGVGMMMNSENIVGTCTSCDQLTTISVDEGLGNCELCLAKERVVFTSYQNQARPSNPSYTYRVIKYQCPSCHAFSLELPDTPDILWD